MWSPYERVVNVLSGGKLERIQALEESNRLILRALEDQTWTRVGVSGGFEMPEMDRQRIVKRCYASWQTNPLAAAYCRLMKVFTFGSGLSKPTVVDVIGKNGKSAGDVAVQKAQDAIDAFWEDTQNQENFIGHKPLGQMSDKSLYEGELFIAMFGDKDAGLIRPAVFNSLDISQVITDPDNHRMELYYKKTKTARKYNFATGIWNANYRAKPDYYASLAYDAWAEGVGNSQDEEGSHKDYLNQMTQKDVRVYHVKLNCDINSTRGIPELYRILDWLRVNKQMAEDLATYIRALARFAWKEKVKGGPAAVEQERQNWERRESSIGRNVPFPAAGTWIENEGADLSPMNISGAIGNIFQIGIRRTLLMVAPGTGIMEHYFGDPSTGNLATAESMELPMVKMFQANQQLWKHTIMMVLYHQCKTASVEGNVILDLDFPQIVPKQVETFIKALVEGSMNGLIHSKAAAELAMVTVGIKNVQHYVEDLYPETQKKVKEVNEGTRRINDTRHLTKDLRQVLKELEMVESDKSAQAHISA